MKVTGIGWSQESVFGYCTSKILGTKISIEVTSGADGSERNMLIFLQYSSMAFVDLESSCTARFGATAKRNVALN